MREGWPKNFVWGYVEIGTALSVIRPGKQTEAAMQKPNTPPIPKRVQQDQATASDAAPVAMPHEQAIPRASRLTVPPALAQYVRDVYGAGWEVVWMDDLNARIRNRSGETLKFSHGGRYQ